jgi:hypothetical protein
VGGVELVEQEQQFAGRRMQARGKLGDRVAQLFYCRRIDLRVARGEDIGGAAKRLSRRKWGTGFRGPPALSDSREPKGPP